MGDGVKRCREVQEDAEAARVSSNQEIVDDLDEGGLSAMLKSEARLEGLIELDMYRWSWPATTLSRVLLGKGRLEIGRWLWRSSGSRPGVLRMGVTEAILKLVGTMPGAREALMMTTM